jgi:Heliorhodopsin
MNLRIFNVGVGLAHAVQGVLMLALSNSLSLPVTASWLTGDPVVARTPDPPHEVFSLAIGPAVALFLFLAAADHLLVAAPGVYRSYERLIDDNRNYMRWIEYSVSAAVMMVLIARFTGITDLAALMGTFALTTSMILFGLLMERQQHPGCADWSAFWFGSLAGAVPWVAVLIYLVNGASPPGSSTPSSWCSSPSSSASPSTWRCSTAVWDGGATTASGKSPTPSSALGPIRYSPGWCSPTCSGT